MRADTQDERLARLQVDAAAIVVPDLDELGGARPRLIAVGLVDDDASGQALCLCCQRVIIKTHM
jgi:hypothetical protein